MASLSNYSANSQYVVKVFSALFGSGVTGDLIASGDTILTAGTSTTLVDVLLNNSVVLNSFPLYGANITDTAFVGALLDNMTKGSGVDATTLTDWKAAVTAALPSYPSRAAAVATLIDAVTNYSGTDTSRIALKTVIDNRAEVGAYAAQNGATTFSTLSALQAQTASVDTTAASVTAAQSGSAQTGTTFTLTTGTDIINGTAGNDTIIGDNSVAASSTVNAGDQINGGAGTDTFKYYGAAATVVLPQLSNVENLVLVAPTATTALDVSANTTLNSVAIQDLAAAIAGVKLNANQTMTLDNVTGGLTATIDYGTTATAATLKVANGVNAGTVNLDGTAIKTLNINSTGKANTITTLASTGTEATVNFTGDQKVTVTNALNASVKTIDASGMTAGGVVVTAGNADVKFTGGAGNDTIKFAASQFNTFDVVDGGAGTDTLSIADTGAPSADLLKAINAAKNFETLAFSGGGATVDASLITNGVTSYQVDTTAGNFALTNVTASGTVTYLALDNSARTDSIANKLGDLTSNVTLTANSTSAAKTGAMTLTGINTVNLKSDFTGTGSQATANAFGTTTGAGTGAGNSDNTKFVVTGSQDLVLAKLAATTTGSTIDASAFTGKLTATGSGKADAITGGSGADTLGGGDITGNTDGGKEQFTATFTGGDGTNAFTVTFDGVATASIAKGATAGDAADAVAAATYTNWDVTHTAGTATVTFTAKTVGNKTFTASADTAAAVDFAVSAGAGGVATVSAVTQGINASAGTGTAAADVLTGGAGADTFKFLGLQESAYAADGSTVDTIKDFVAGTDKLDISGIVHDVTNSATGASTNYVYTSSALVAQSTVQASVNAASPSTLAAAVTAAATQITADKVGAFQYGGDTYVFLNDHIAAVGTTDGLIKLSGAVTLAATDFVFHA